MHTTKHLWWVCLATLHLAGGLDATVGDPPPLARLAFWLPPEHVSGFATEFGEHLEPLLHRHHLTLADEAGRPTPDSVFSRLVIVDSPAVIAEASRRLQADTAWVAAIHGICQTLNIDTIPVTLRHYRSAALPSRIVDMGPGYRAGDFQNYSFSDGLPSPVITALLQDHTGVMWMGTGWGGGLVRYDGSRLATFTVADGLSSANVIRLKEDDTGRLWIVTWDGISLHYDGFFESFDGADGVPENVVISCAEDHLGRIWFAAGDLVFRLGDDGTETVPTPTQGGIALFEDSQREQVWLSDARGLWKWTDDGFTEVIIVADGLSTHSTDEGAIQPRIQDRYEDRSGAIWLALDEGVLKADGHGDAKRLGVEEGITITVHGFADDSAGTMWMRGGEFGLLRYDGRHANRVTITDGLASDQVNHVVVDDEGSVWVSTWNGLSRYDGERTKTLTLDDGLADNGVMAIHALGDTLWFGTWRGVSRYDGGQLSEVEAAGFGNTWSITTDQQGHRWFAQASGVLLEVAGEQVRRHDLGDKVTVVMQDTKGVMWAGTNYPNGGLFRKSGSTFEKLTENQGLPATLGINDILEDRAGTLWLATTHGIWRREGELFASVSADHGLAEGLVFSIMEDAQGVLWFAANTDGVIRFEHGRLAQLSDLATDDRFYALAEDDRGHMWFGTYGGGIWRYDGTVTQRLSRRHGLPHDTIHDFHIGADGTVWIATEGGVTRYRSSRRLPAVQLTQVTTDQAFGEIEELDVTVSQPVTLSFRGHGWTTGRGDMVYQHRLLGHDEAWKTTREERVTYTNLETGDYLFEVVAIDLDLNRSAEPARLRLTVHPDYYLIGLTVGLGLALLGLVVVAVYAVQKRRQQQVAERALHEEMEHELAVAHDLQMGLMPKQSPALPGYEIAGHCIPAGQVGGDMYKYYELPDGRLAAFVADVTGHAMEAAVPLMVFAGVVETMVNSTTTAADLLARLNLALLPVVPKQSFVCLSAVLLDPRTHKLTLTNAGCPYPCCFQASRDDLIEVELSAYPLAVRDHSTYEQIEVDLGPGDYAILCSDGIVEVTDATDETLGYEGVNQLLSEGCQQRLSAPDLLQHIFAGVSAFRGEAPQTDDMTCVVIRREVDERAVM